MRLGIEGLNAYDSYQTRFRLLGANLAFPSAAKCKMSYNFLLIVGFSFALAELARSLSHELLSERHSDIHLW